MRQQQYPARGELRRMRQEGAPGLPYHVHGSQCEEQSPVGARTAAGELPVPPCNTYKDITLYLHLPFQRAGALSGVSPLICILVSLLFMPIQPPDRHDNNKIFSLHSTAAASLDNVDVDDVKHGPRRMRYVRRCSPMQTGAATATDDAYMLAANTSYVFDAAVPPTTLTPNEHHRLKGATHSGVPGEQGTAKRCAVLVWAHEWPLPSRRKSGAKSKEPFDWSRHWYYFKRELERRGEYDRVVVVAPDARSTGRVKTSVVTSVYHYAALLARRTQRVLASLLQPERGPEPEQGAFTSDPQPAPPCRVPPQVPHLVDDDVITPPRSRRDVGRLFSATSESTSGSRNGSSSGGCTFVNASPSAFSSSTGSAYDFEGLYAVEETESRSSSAVPPSPKTPLADSPQADALGPHAQPEDGSKQTPRQKSFFKFPRLSKILPKRSLQLPKKATTSCAAGTTVDNANKSDQTTSRAAERTEDEDGELTSGLTCTRVELFLLGRGVGGLALRLMAAAPTSGLWNDPQDPQAILWQESVLNFHRWLSGKVLEPEGSSSAEADLVWGGMPERRQTKRSTATAPISSSQSLNSLSSSLVTARHTKTFCRDRSGSAPSTTSCATGCTSTSAGKDTESREPLGTNRGLLMSLLHYTSTDTFGLSTSDTEASDTESCPFKEEEQDVSEKDEEDQGKEEDGESKGDNRGTQALSSRRGVWLRSVVLEETPLAGEDSRRNQSALSNTRSKAATSRVIWKWGATRQALRLSTALGRLSESAQSSVNRVLLHLDRSSLLCRLAREEKQTYVLQDTREGSLMTLFETVLYYGRMNPSKPSVAATELGIAYPLLMQSAAAHKLYSSNDLKRPCKMINVTASSLNAPNFPSRLGRKVVHGDRGCNPRRRQAAKSPASVPASVAASKSTGCHLAEAAGILPRSKKKKRAAAVEATQRSSGTGRRKSASTREGLAFCETTQSDSTQEDVSDTAEEDWTSSNSPAEAGYSRGGMKKCDIGVSLTPRRTTNGCDAGATVAAAPLDARTDIEEAFVTEQGYEADSGSDSSADQGDRGRQCYKARKLTTERAGRRGSRSAVVHADLLTLLLSPTDVCKVTPRKNLYNVTLTLLELINLGQRPHPYNPTRIGVWKTHSPRFVRRKAGSAGGKRHEDIFGTASPSEDVGLDRENVLLHMSVRAFQRKKSVRRWDFNGDKNIYSKAWFSSCRTESFMSHRRGRALKRGLRRRCADRC